MGASYLVDLGNTTQLGLTIGLGGAGSGLVYSASGAVIGQTFYMGNADSVCNVLIAGNEVFGSGQLRVQVQCADTDTSGSYTDPTSGLAQLPSWMSSGGIFILNSGGTGNGTIGAFVSGHAIQSGFAEAGFFQRVGLFARANVLSGDFYAGPLTVTLVSQDRTTGSGGGFSYQPGSGTVNV